jgi:ectoine hydroxylase-related dioxygenase (phytanoyl-CoA dioxygenase family)
MQFALSQPFSSSQQRHAAAPSAIQLLAQGYVVLRQAVPPELIQSCAEELDDHFQQTPFCEGVFYGGLTKRFGCVLRHSAAAAQLIQHPAVLAITEIVLGPYCDTIQLNLSQGIEIHPNAPAQFPHRDQDMWSGPKGELEYLVNVMWPFSAYTPENGSTIIWPNSHLWSPDAMPDDGDAGISLSLEPGDVLLFLGSTLHNGGANKTQDIRRGMIVSYSLGWLKSFENQFLAYPPEVARNFDPVLAELIGYRQHRPNLGNYEGQSPAVLLMDDLPPHLAATDALRPDQQAQVDAFIANVAQAA